MLTGTKTHSDIYGERELIKTINKREKIETEQYKDNQKNNDTNIADNYATMQRRNGEKI